MRCPNRRTVAATLLLLATACSDASRPAPTQPPLGGPRASILVPTGTEIRNQIGLVFPAGGLRNAALTQFDNVDRSKGQGRLSVAQSQAGALIDFVLRALNDGKLVAPSGGSSAFDDPSNPGSALPAASAQAAAAQLVGAVSVYVGLGGGGASRVDAAAVYVPVSADTPIVVRTGTGLAAVRIPPHALGADALVTITPIDYQGFPVGFGPLNTKSSGLRQYPFFYELQTFPAIPSFAAPVLVQLCQIETGPYAPPEAIHPRLQLAHNVGADLQILPREFAPDLACTTSVSSMRPAPMESEGWLARGKWAARELPLQLGRWLGPATAYAAHGGLAGASSSFSPFGAVDVGSGAVQLRPNVVSLSSYTSGGVNFFATDASGAPLDLACGGWTSSNPNVGSFGGPFYPSGATGSTTITAVCGSIDATAGTPVAQIVQIVP